MKLPAWFPRTATICRAAGGKVHIWDLESGKSLAGPLDRSVLLSGDARWLLALSRDRVKGLLVAGYELATGRRAWELETEVNDRYASVFASRYDGRFLARDRDGRLRVYETATGEAVGPGVAAPATASASLLPDRGPLRVGNSGTGMVSTIR
jgi:hypothetical protein